ncbi:MAG: hypothetical protein AAGD32_11835 [Planctomycetota bacterium]
MPEQLVQIVYWIGLTAWGGATLVFVVALPALFAEVNRHDPTMPRLLSAELAGEHAGVLNGVLVDTLAHVVLRIGGFAALLLGFAVLGRWGLALRTGADSGAYIRLGVATALLLGAAAVLIYGLLRVRPRAAGATDALLTANDDPEHVETLRNNFAATHRELTTIVQIQLLVLLGMVLFGG